MKSSKRKLSSVGSDNEYDDEYRSKRDRNNQAVKRSRIKQKQRTQETQDRVDALKEKNLKLEASIENGQKTLTLLKDLFLAQAKTKNDELTKEQLYQLLADDDDDDEEQAPSTSSSASSSRQPPSATSSNSRKK